jgi:hypothetical protein
MEIVPKAKKVMSEDSKTLSVEAIYILRTEKLIPRALPPAGGDIID